MQGDSTQLPCALKCMLACAHHSLHWLLCTCTPYFVHSSIHTTPARHPANVAHASSHPPLPCVRSWPATWSPTTAAPASCTTGTRCAAAAMYILATSLYTAQLCALHELINCGRGYGRCCEADACIQAPGERMLVRLMGPVAARVRRARTSARCARASARGRTVPAPCAARPRPAARR